MLLYENNGPPIGCLGNMEVLAKRASLAAFSRSPRF
jgi:hypothetical protein